MSNDQSFTTSQLQVSPKSRSRSRHLSNNVDFSMVQKELALLNPDNNQDDSRQLSQPRSRHHRSISDFVRSTRGSIADVTVQKNSSITDVPNPTTTATSSIQTIELKFNREMSDIEDGDGAGSDFEQDETSDNTGSAEEIEIDPAKIDDIQLKEAAAQTLSAEPDENEPRTIFGSIREAVTTSVRLAMDSRLALRRNRHQMFRSLQREVPDVVNTDGGLVAGDSAGSSTGRNVFDQKNYRQCLQHPNLRPLGILEVKRLWCALRYLIDEKNVEQFLRKYTPNTSLIIPSDGDPLASIKPREGSARGATLHYTHRFSSSGDVHLAPSLEGLMRQQVLASRNHADSDRKHSTLVNRHSLPNARRVSVKGLNGQEFRRASVAGIETSPRIDSLGLNSETISSIIPEEFLRKENEQFNIVFQQYFKPEMERTMLNSMVPLPPIIAVRGYEKRLYKNLCAFLLSCLSIEQGTNRYMMKLIQTGLSYLRSIEECESSRVCKGFVNKIDNYLAILLFRAPGSEDELGKPELPFLKTFPRSKSNALSSQITDDLAATGSSMTSDSQHLATLRSNMVRGAASPNPRMSLKVLGIHTLIFACGLAALYCVWMLLYPGSISAACDRYGHQLSSRIESGIAVDRLVAELALNVPKEVIDDCTKNSRFDLIGPHLAVMASSLETVGGSWIFLPDSGAFAAAIRFPSGADIGFIERKNSSFPCWRFNATSAWRKPRNRLNTTITCPNFLNTNITVQNWSSPISIDGSPSAYGHSQVRMITSFKRTVVIGVHFTTKLVNEALENALLGDPQDGIILREATSGRVISASRTAEAIVYRPDSSSRTITSPTKVRFANTTAEIVVGVSIPVPLSNIEYSVLVSLIVSAIVLLIFVRSRVRPPSLSEKPNRQVTLIQTVLDERPSTVLQREHVYLLLVLVVSLCVVLLLLLYASSDKSLETISDATWFQLGESLQERFRLLPSVARLVSSAVVLQLTDGSMNSKTSDTRIYAIATDALTRMTQMPSEAMFAYSVGIWVKGSFSGKHLPNVSNPDPRTFSLITLQKEVDVTQSDWFRGASSTGMFGSLRQLMIGGSALPFGKSVNVTNFGRCVVLLDFGTDILANYVNNYVSLINLKSITLRYFDYPSFTLLASTESSEKDQKFAPSNIRTDTISRRSIFDRDSLSLNIPYVDSQTSWISNGLFSFHEVCGDVLEVSLTAWIAAIGVVIVVLFLVGSTSSDLEHRQILPWNYLSDSDSIIALAKEEPSKAALTHHLINIRPKIISASGQSWRRKRNLRAGDVGDYDQPLDFDEIQNHVSERAVRHVRDALHNRNILSLCELESHESPIAAGLYMLISHNLSRAVLFIVAIVHIGLQFFEPQTQLEMSQDGTDSWILITEGLCLLVEITYMSLHFGVKYHLLAMDNILSRVESSLAIDMMTVIILALTCLDWLFTMTLNFSFEYACPLRPWIFLLFFADLRRGLSLFMRAMVRAFDVILLWMSIIFIFALFGVILFRTNLNIDTNNSSFANIRDALITCFVFAATADNFSDLIYNAYKENPLFMLFFVVLWMIGMFCILAMVVGYFQHEFVKQQGQNVRQKTLITRTGMIAAFILIDVDQSGGISVEEFKDFVSGCANHDATATRRAFMKMFRNIDTNGDGQMDIFEFVMGIEDLTLNRLFLGRRQPATDSKWRRWMRENVFHAPSDWWRKLIEFLLLIELTAACTYGTVKNINKIDEICHGLLIFFTVEMLTKLLVYGATEMLIHGHYDGSMFERRFDTIVVLGSFITYYAIRFHNRSNQVTLQTQDEVSLRMLQLVPVTRIFSQVKLIRHVVTTFLRSAREFFNMFCLLLIIMDIYACVGVFLFSGMWSDPENPGANFDSHSNAFLVLIECMVQQDWRNIMYNAISTFGWSASLYFISFTFLISILFTNLFLGIILTQFSKIVQHKRETKAALQKPMLNQSQHHLFSSE